MPVRTALRTMDPRLQFVQADRRIPPCDQLWAGPRPISESLVAILGHEIRRIDPRSDVFGLLLRAFEQMRDE